MLQKSESETVLGKAARLAGYLSTHPAAVPRWLSDRLASGDPMTRRLPWFSWPAIRWLDRWLQPAFTVFEIGGGGSTLWFADRVKRVVTLDADPAWLSRLRACAPANVELIHGSTPGQLAPGRPDLLVIDGPDGLRAAALRWAMDRSLNALLDDSWRYRESLPPTAKLFPGIGPCRLGITETAIVPAGRAEG